MTFSINSNNFSFSRNINNAGKIQNQAIQRLSSFLGINSAKDDPAGSAIIQRQTAQIRGTNQAIRNANDGISFMQSAQGGLKQVSSNLQRMRELSVQAANSITGDRSAIQSEINQLADENSRINKTASFNGQALFSENSKNVSFQVGADASSDNQISVELQSLDSLNSVSNEKATHTIDVSSAESAQSAIAQIDADLDSVSSQMSKFGAIENRFSSAISNAEEHSINLQQSRSRIADADIAKEVSKLIQAQILEQASIATASQANQSKKMVLSLLGGGAR